MNKFRGFLKTKGFYVALGTGIVAFVAMLVVYNYSVTNEEIDSKSAIDLNQPVESEESIDDNGLEQVKDEKTSVSNDVAGATDADKVDAENQVATNETDENKKEEITDVNSDVAVADVDGNAAVVSENMVDEVVDSAVPASSDATGVDFTEDTVLYTALEYNGEQNLVWPVTGNVILPYSMDTTVYYQTMDAYKCNPGILIEASEGDDVFAAYEGIISSIEETKEYGTVVTVTMGNGYEAKYGQLMNVCVSEGDMVSVSQTLAEVAPVSSYFVEEGTNLYFQISKDGEPVNPMDLIQ